MEQVIYQQNYTPESLAMENTDHITLTGVLNNPGIENTAVIRDELSSLLWRTNLSKRAINVCKLHDLTGREQVRKGFLSIEEFQPLATIKDLSKWSKKELLELQNCGYRTITEFEALLGKYGLTLKDEQ